MQIWHWVFVLPLLILALGCAIAVVVWLCSILFPSRPTLGTRERRHQQTLAELRELNAHLRAQSERRD